MTGQYELAKNDNNQHKFTLKAGDGEVILTSKKYKKIQARNKGIASIMKTGPVTKVKV